MRKTYNPCLIGNCACVCVRLSVNIRVHVCIYVVYV
uniref:Uncharacterized protein n=1 Tax=Anguilla anguilla TaxID=7936 RepID=A0A0E9PBI0_ANGAN